MSNNLNPDKALIFRIVHRDNVAWILDHGLHCRSSPVFDPNYANIDNPELIDKRSHRAVPVAPGGVLSDYVPFYFTPYSPMMLNIKTGHGGVVQRPNEDIVILVSSLHKIAELEIAFVFSDRHAYLQAAQFSSSVDDLDRIGSTGSCYKNVISSVTRMIPARWSVIKPRRWCTGMCR